MDGSRLFLRLSGSVAGVVVDKTLCASYLTLDNFTTTLFDMENVYDCHTYCLAGGMHTINLNIFLFLVILITLQETIAVAAKSFS